MCPARDLGAFRQSFWSPGLDLGALGLDLGGLGCLWGLLWVAWGGHLGGFEGTLEHKM